jgi:serine/threonine-protein kinase
VSDARIVAETILAGRYRLIRLIDRGGMAEVWEGRDEILDRPVAVKVLHPKLAGNEEFQERFRLEAVSAARLSHPNIVSTYDTGIDEGVAYIVMELVPGHPLRETLRNEGPLSPARAVAIAAAVADALDAAHRAGIVHRDVKPGNILVTDDGRVKVADFGIAKAATDADLTQSGALLGTAKYVPPEHVEGRPQDRRSDVYGLGVVLYEMLCGRPPFTGESDMAVAFQHAHADPVRPRQLRGDIPRKLENVVLKAMAKSPEQRYPTAGDLRRVLLSLPLESDDDATTTLFAPESPTAVRAAPSFVESERSWLVPTVLIVVLAVVLGIVGYLFSRSHTGQNLLGTSSNKASTAGAAPQVRDVLAFDPDGDGREHNADLPKLTDHDASSTWSTEHYDSGLQGAGKPGVGVVLVLDRSQGLRRLQVTSSTRGWNASVYLADAPKTALGQWGAPVTNGRVSGQGTSFDLHGRTGAAVLLWITDLGGNQSVTVDDLQLTS